MKGTELLKQAIQTPIKADRIDKLDDRWKKLDAVKLALDKQFNTTTSIVRLGEKVNIPIPSYSTGLYTLDKEVIGTGGIPKGRIIEVFGPESSGKTSIALQIISEIQKQGDLCAYIDSEHALDVTYASKLGVDIKNLLISQPDSGEQALETAETLVESGAIGAIVIDSVAALVPQAELDGDMGESHMGLQARLMSQAMRKLRGKCHAFDVPIIFINQIREKIGGYGNPETTTGGRALRFYASLRLEIRKVPGEAGIIKQGSETIGHVVRIKAVKNKVDAPLKETNVNLVYGVGFDKDMDVIDYAIGSGIVVQAGAWCKFEGESYRKADLVNIKDKIIDAVNATTKTI